MIKSKFDFSVGAMCDRDPGPDRIPRKSDYPVSSSYARMFDPWAFSRPHNGSLPNIFTH